MRKILLFLFLFLVSKNYAQTDYSFIYNTDSIIKKGISLHNAEKYDEALKEYRKISKTDPKFLTAQYEIALTLNAQDKKDELKSFFEDLHQQGKMEENPELFQIYAIFLSNEKEYDASEKIFNEGKKHIGNSSSFLYNLAILYARKGESQKSVDILKNIITQNPNHASSHYLLGVTAFENGKITEGTLAFMSYLLLAPKGTYANQVITNLNANYGQNFLAENKLVFSKSGDNFEEIETILRNQLPLKKVYKIQSSIDDVITRQVQAVAEYAVEHKMEGGFFETTYIPWVKQMVEKKQLEGFSYYSLLSQEDKIGKELSKQKKKIIVFSEDYVQKELWPVFGKRKLDMFGTTEEVIVSIENQRPYIIGKQINGLFDGKCKYLNEFQNLAGELNFKNGVLEGTQRYFDSKGNLIEEKSFESGKVNGKRTTYYENGNIALIENYKNNILEGVSTSYYINGGKKCEVNFVNGEREGTFNCLYENGNKKNEIEYSKNKINGKYSHYNETGDLIENYTCVNDKIDGNYFEYFDGKTIKSEAVYKNGIMEGTFKTYYPNKTLQKETFSNLGKITKAVEYGENGRKKSETLYNDKEEPENYVYFDNDGNKYFEEKYKSGELKAGIQFSKNSPKGTDLSLNKNFEVKNYDGSPRIKGNFEKGKKSGEWIYLYDSETVKLKESYLNGKINGISTNYNSAGNITSINNFVNDTISGIYELYNANKLSQISHYDKGQQNGPYKTFYSDGMLNSEGFIMNNEISSNKIKYSQNGKISSIENYLEGKLISIKTFDPSGKLENNIDFKNKTGKSNTTFNNGVYSENSVYTNGILNGKYVSEDKFKTKIVDAEYTNGLLQNSYTSYGPLGYPIIETNYYNGVLNGSTKYYDYAGSLRLSLTYIFGLENGKTVRYYNSKSKMVETDYVNNICEGNATYYNQKGEPILILGYENNLPKFYIRKNKSGELNEKIVIENQTAQVASLYPNGKTAIQFNLNKGSFNGKFVINSPEGKTDFECNYNQSLLDGDRIEYYPNGKMYKKEHFVNNEYDGEQKYYKEDGQLWANVSLKNDNLHGKTLIYNWGKLVETKKYDSDELVEVIK